MRTTKRATLGLILRHVVLVGVSIITLRPLIHAQRTFVSMQGSIGAQQGYSVPISTPCDPGACSISCPIGTGQCIGGGPLDSRFGGALNVAKTDTGNGFAVSFNGHAEANPNSSIYGLGFIAGFAVNVDAKIKPGTQLLLSTTADYQMTWSNQDPGDHMLNLSFSDNCTVSASTSVLSGPESTASRRGIASALCLKVSGSTDPEGKTRFEVVHVDNRMGVPGARSYPVSASYNGTLTFSYKVVGKVMKKVSGDGQTGIVNSPLPQPVKVQVIQGDTGAPVSGVAISFSATGGASVQASSTTDPTGYAGTYVSLGSSVGTYTITANCAQCVADYTLTFVETAVSSITTIQGDLRDAPNDLVCDSVSIGSVSGPINPDGSFSIPNVAIQLNPNATTEERKAIFHCADLNATCPVVGGLPIDQLFLDANQAKYPGCGTGFFGQRKTRMHKGMDIRGGDGQVVAATPGVVVFVGQFKKCFGGKYNQYNQCIDDSYRLDINNDKSWGWIVVTQEQLGSNLFLLTIYGHLQPTVPGPIKVGDQVVPGETIIGEIGQSGNANVCPPEVHAETRLSKDPLKVSAFLYPGTISDGNNQLFLLSRDMHANGNAAIFLKAHPINPDRKFGCNLYKVPGLDP